MAKMAIPNRALIDALVTAGVITNPNNVARVVIDIRGGQPPQIYVRQFADEQMQAVIDAVLADMEPGPLVEPADAAPLVRPDGGE